MPARPENQPPAEAGWGLGVSPPHDSAAEMAVLGAILRAAQYDTTQAATLLTGTPQPGDYYRPQHERLARHLARAAANGRHLDPASILASLTDTGDFKQGWLDGPYLHTLIEHAAPSSSVDHLAQRVQRYARIRAAQQATQRALQRLNNPYDEGVLDVLVDAMDVLEDAVQVEIHGARHTSLAVEDIDQMLAGEDDEYDWIVPGLLERQDRLIITGGEGHGKSTFLRQLGIQFAMGLHPFTGETFPPLTVLYIDLENSRRQFRRKTRAMRTQAGQHLDPACLRVSIRTEGLDLTQPQDIDWLERHVAAIRPDVLITGPIYKLANGDPTEEKSAKPVAMALDKIRAHYGCAVILEAHSAKALGGSKKRAHEPYGWSGWLRWPEFGIWLDKDGDIEHWRQMRDERDWPELLQRGGAWPWSVAGSETAVRWRQIRAATQSAGRRLTFRQLEDETGVARTTIQRVLGEYAMQYEALLAQITQEDEA